MIKFTLLTMKNFLSFGADPTTLLLDHPGTTLIVGQDLDNVANGIGANGVGKTVIINALTYGVYDKPVSNISKDNLVNNINKSHMEVVVEFQKDGNTYRIKRARKSKNYAAGNFVELFENDVDITPDSVVNTNKLIEKIIGLPYELFVRIVVFSATHTPFLDLPIRSQSGANQTDIIEELFDLKTLSQKSETLTEQRKEIEVELRQQKERVEMLEQESERHNKQLESAKQRVIQYDQTTATEIEQLRKKLDRMQTIDVEGQQELHEELLENILTLGEASGLLKSQLKELKNATTNLKKAEEELTHLKDEKCPYCKQKYADTGRKIKEAKKVISDSNNTIQRLNKSISKTEELVEDGRVDQKDIEEQITIQKDELDALEERNSEYERRLAELENTVNPYLEPLYELEEVNLGTINYDKINTLTKRVEHMKFLYKLLTKKDSFVRKVLLNKNLPFLNQRLQKYLTDLGLLHQVEFTHEMTANITQFGRQMDFGNLSAGQRARVNIALSFAFRDVLQNLHERINICMLDEVLDVGLDGPGVTAAARMLKRKAREEKLSLYIISHRDEIDSAFDHTMTVQLSGGFSYILEEK